jgi:hypothetical protein
MKKIGGYIALFGLLTIVLDLFDREPTLLQWIYNWGDTAAWTIKIGLVVIGGALFFMGGKKQDEATIKISNAEGED